MLYLAFIFHMHQPYYKNLLTGSTDMPWVRLHGVKDYLDMAQILSNYPAIHQTFNLVPCLVEQIEDYTNHRVKDKFLELSFKPAKELTGQEKEFIREHFFSINLEKVISILPRYYELYLKKEGELGFSIQEYLDLQVWFNLSWIDPIFRQDIPELRNLVSKARLFTEEEKRTVLEAQEKILKQIIPAYKKFAASSQIELTCSPYYHPILPLLYNTNTAKEANPKAILPKLKFAYPQDCQAQIQEAVNFHKSRFGLKACGMWPSEEAVSEHILPFIIGAGLNWIVTDEAILFKSLKTKKRDTKLLYQPHLLKRKEGSLNIIFRDRNLSDLIGFVYQAYKAENAVDDFIKHLENISLTLNKEEDILVTVAMDGENAWEYFPNDGGDFLNLLYKRLSDSKNIKAVTISEYLKLHPATLQIKRLAAGSWISAEFSKWINNPYKNKAWEYLAEAREELERWIKNDRLGDKLDLALKQIYICEGSDWFWWYGEGHDDFDRLFRMHLTNFYAIIGKPVPDYLKKPLTT